LFVVSCDSEADLPGLHSVGVGGARSSQWLQACGLCPEPGVFQVFQVLRSDIACTRPGRRTIRERCGPICSRGPRGEPARIRSWLPCPVCGIVQPPGGNCCWLRVEEVLLDSLQATWARALYAGSMHTIRYPRRLRDWASLLVGFFGFQAAARAVVCTRAGRRCWLPWRVAPYLRAVFGVSCRCGAWFVRCGRLLAGVGPVPGCWREP